MKNELNFSATHCFAFIYIAFAHQTDGKFLRSEQKVIWQTVTNWTSEGTSYMEFAKIMDESIKRYSELAQSETIFKTVKHLAEWLNSLEWFTLEKRLLALQNLNDIAEADDNFIEEEQIWIDSLAEIWKIPNYKADR